ncbi:MAG: BolA family transcriptional regulator [Candidatus Midichloriaceae bacterium]|jgi:BolA protein|nr:BolA family transcriptional regulator [Candidatus Midichloriaceae bacterium]
MRERIESILQNSFAPTVLEAIDESHKHFGHVGNAGFEQGESHFKITIKSQVFDGLTRLECHRLIYQKLGKIMPKIHALEIVIL